MRRGLARAVRAEQAEDFALMDFQIEFGTAVLAGSPRLVRRVFDPQVSYFNGMVRVHGLGLRGRGSAAMFPRRSGKSEQVASSSSIRF